MSAMPIAVGIIVGLVVIAGTALMAYPPARRGIKAGVGILRALATDKRIPRPLRWLLLGALLPIPGPFEEIAGGLAVGIIALRYRTVLDEHRRASRGGH